MKRSVLIFVLIVLAAWFAGGQLDQNTPAGAVATHAAPVWPSTACAHLDWWAQGQCAPGWIFRPYLRNGYPVKGQVSNN